MNMKLREKILRNAKKKWFERMRLRETRGFNSMLHYIPFVECLYGIRTPHKLECNKIFLLFNVISA